jgi:hypothetical protein
MEPLLGGVVGLVGVVVVVFVPSVVVGGLPDFGGDPMQQGFDEGHVGAVTTGGTPRPGGGGK